MKQRNIGMCIVLSIVTCGIYAIVWLYNLIQDTAELAPEENINAGMALLFSFLTCGIYTLYMYYKMGDILYQKGTQRGVYISDNKVLLLILGLFGFGIIAYAIIQSDLNKIYSQNDIYIK